MRVIRALLITAVLGVLLFSGGPAMGMMIASWTFGIPALFVAALLALAIWKIRDLVQHDSGARHRTVTKIREEIP